MKIAYLAKASSSGSNRSLLNAIKNAGQDVYYNEMWNNIELNRKEGLSLKNLCNSPRYFSTRAVSTLLNGRNWRAGMDTNPYIFRKMSHISYSILQNMDFDVVLMSQTLFNPYLYVKPIKPFYIITDHTHALSKMLPPIPGQSSPAYTTKYWDKMELNCYRDATRIFPRSKYVADSLINDYGIDAEKIHVVETGPNIPILDSHSEKTYDGKTIVFAAGTWIGKGGEHLLEAFRMIRKEIPDSILKIACPNIVNSESGIEWLGWLSKSELQKLFKTASLFILPTLREAFPLSCVEAMAYKVPCITTNIEANPEINIDGEVVILVEPGKPEKIAEAAIEILKDIRRMEHMGTLGYKLIKNRYNWEIVANKLISYMKNDVKIY